MKNTYLLGAALGAVLGGVVAFAVTRTMLPKTAETTADITEAQQKITVLDREGYPDLTFAAETAVRAVVNIENIRANRWGGVAKAGGSGVIISRDGYIVTNNHVVQNAVALRVKLNDERLFDATLVGTDPSTDVAVIKIEAADLPALPMGNSDSLRLGEWVLAIGSPFDLQSTITAGIVSAKGRSLSAGAFDVQSFIQTDAAVNAGNSGGALVNTRGELVGINTAITSPTGAYTGYSFAVPVSIVRRVTDDLRSSGQVQRAMLGISFIELEQGGGLLVHVVARSSGAQAAGVEPGDIITSIDGIATPHATALQEHILLKRPGDRVRLEIKRKEQVKQIEVELRNTNL